MNKPENIIPMPSATEPGDWKTVLREAVTDPGELLDLLQLPRSRWLAGAHRAAQAFPLKAPRGYLSRIRTGDPQDPLLRQVLPLMQETEVAAGFAADPLQEHAGQPSPGLIHKYHGRALMISTGACAVHCRYCFRRHFPYASAHTGGQLRQQALDVIRGDESLREIILSGGDPLMLDDGRLGEMLDALQGIKHIRRIRIHTRMPVAIPERASAALCDLLYDRRPDMVVVIHCNHAREIDAAVAQALDRLHRAGVRLYNQAVLLRGVNDHATVQCELAETLFEHRVQPYYLHQLDRVQGAAHFEVTELQSRQIYREMQARLPGYLLPRLVRELPGADSKISIHN